MRYVAIIMLSLTLLSCGASQPLITPLKNHLVTKCYLIAACLPPIELHGMSPIEFCDWLDNLGELAEFVTECDACQIK